MQFRNLPRIMAMVSFVILLVMVLVAIFTRTQRSEIMVVQVTAVLRGGMVIRTEPMIAMGALRR